MGVTSRARTVLLIVAIATLVASVSEARARQAAAGSSMAPRARRAAGAARPRDRVSGHGSRVAVQPFEGPSADSMKSLRTLRALIVRIVRGRGFRTMTSLPRYDGTGQYPVLARDHHLAAFVTADMEERGRWQRITFLVWNGLTGSVVGRWTASAQTTALPGAVGKGFWQHLGPAIQKAEAPPLPPALERAPPIRIDASDPMDDGQLATR